MSDRDRTDQMNQGRSGQGRQDDDFE
jgi:hypothetical protein